MCVSRILLFLALATPVSALADSELSQFWRILHFTDISGNSVSASLHVDAKDPGTYWLKELEICLNTDRKIRLPSDEMSRLVFPQLSETRLIESFGVTADKTLYALALKIPVLGYVMSNGEVIESDGDLDAIFVLAGEDKGRFYLRQDGGSIIESRLVNLISSE